MEDKEALMPEQETAETAESGVLNILGLDKIRKISDNSNLEINIIGLDKIHAEEEGEAVTGLEMIRPIEEEGDPLTGLEMIHAEQEGEALSEISSLLDETEEVNIIGTDRIRHIFFNQFPKMSAFALELLSLTERARHLDFELKLYGARQHRYEFAPVLPLTEVRDFEKRHRITLPSGYVEFLTQVGNGGAGPDFGIFSLDELEFCNFYTHSNRCVPQALAKAEPDYFDFSYTTAHTPVVLDSALTERKWEGLCTELQKLNTYGSEAAYERKRRELYNGVLQIVHTDAPFCPSLICQGDRSGEILEFSHDLEMPRFSDKTFEEWLLGYFESVIRMFSESGNE